MQVISALAASQSLKATQLSSSLKTLSSTQDLADTSSSCIEDRWQSNFWAKQCTFKGPELNKNFRCWAPWEFSCCTLYPDLRGYRACSTSADTSLSNMSGVCLHFIFYLCTLTGSNKISLKINHRMVHGALWFFGHENSPILFMMSRHQKNKKVFYFCWLFTIDFSCNITWKEYSFTNKLQEGPLGFIACAGKDQNLLEHSLLLLGTGNPRELQIRLCIFTFTILFICVLYCWQRKGF